MVFFHSKSGMIFQSQAAIGARQYTALTLSIRLSHLGNLFIIVGLLGCVEISLKMHCFCAYLEDTIPSTTPCLPTRHVSMASASGICQHDIRPPRIGLPCSLRANLRGYPIQTWIAYARESPDVYALRFIYCCYMLHTTKKHILHHLMEQTFLKLI